MGNKTPEKPRSWIANNRIFIAIVCSHLVFLLVCVILGLHLLVCKYYEQKIVYPVLSAKPVDVISIVVGPIKTRSTKFNLVSLPLTIVNPDDIKRICDELNKSRPFSPNHPMSSWESLLVFNTNSGSYMFIVDSTESSRNGVLVSFHSNGEWGWNVGEYRSDMLGPTLEEVVRSYESSVAKPQKAQPAAAHVLLSSLPRYRKQ